MKMTGPTQYAMPELPAPKVNVAVPIHIVNHSNAQVETQTKAGSNGIQEIEILITNAMSKAIAQGKMDPALRARFDHRPALARR